MVYWSESPPIVSQIKLGGIASGLGMLEGVCSCLERKITKIYRNFQHMLVRPLVWPTDLTRTQKKCKNERYTIRAFQNIKNYQNRFTELGERCLWLSFFFAKKKPAGARSLKKTRNYVDPACIVTGSYDAPKYLVRFLHSESVLT